jgi:hypothetical protein
MSINKLVSIKNPIINALDLAALDHDKHLPLFMTWAYQAEEEIGSYYQFERQWACLDICGCVATLPDNAIKLEGAIMGEHGVDCGNIFNTVFSNKTFSSLTGDNSFLVVDVNDVNTTSNCGMVPFHCQDNKLIFDNCLKQDKITIQYLGYKLDCDGFMEIGQNHVEAITHHILYKWCMRKRKKGGADLQEMQWHYREWDRLCAHSRALDADLSISDREEIADMYHNPYSGRGLYVGMNRNNNNYGRISY